MKLVREIREIKSSFILGSRNFSNDSSKTELVHICLDGSICLIKFPRDSFRLLIRFHMGLRTGMGSSAIGPLRDRKSEMSGGSKQALVECLSFAFLIERTRQHREPMIRDS